MVTIVGLCDDSSATRCGVVFVTKNLQRWCVSVDMWSSLSILMDKTWHSITVTVNYYFSRFWWREQGTVPKLKRATVTSFL